jgi:hypothetical protein
MSLVLLDDAIDLCQPQAGSLTRRLGGEKRFEKMRQYIFWNATACIGYCDAYPLPSRDVSAPVQWILASGSTRIR